MWSLCPVLLLLLCTCCWAESGPIVQTKYGKVSRLSSCDVTSGNVLEVLHQQEKGRDWGGGRVSALGRGSYKMAASGLALKSPRLEPDGPFLSSFAQMD